MAGTHHGKTASDEDTLTLTEKIEQKLRAACDKYEDLHEKIDHLHDQVDDLSVALVKTVKKRPIMALGIAVACGIAIGKIIK